MTHSREEFALRPVGFLGVLLGVPEGFLGPLTRGNVTKDSNATPGITSLIDQWSRRYTQPCAFRASVVAHKYLYLIGGLTSQSPREWCLAGWKGSNGIGQIETELFGPLFRNSVLVAYTENLLGGWVEDQELTVGISNYYALTDAV